MHTVAYGVLLFLRQASSDVESKRTDRKARAGGLRVCFFRETNASGRSSTRPLNFNALNRPASTSACTVRQERIATPRLASTKVLITWLLFSSRFFVRGTPY